MQPHVVGIGGTATVGSSTEQALAIALASAREAGAQTRMFGSTHLIALPHYLSPASKHSAVAREILAAIRSADGLIVASPGYHGSVSGLVKNAIDYVEETARDERIYLDGMPVGLIATSYGWQASSSTLATLRAIVHSLRGWPTPLGAAINCSSGVFKDGVCTDLAASKQLQCVGRQVCDFAALLADMKEAEVRVVP